MGKVDVRRACVILGFMLSVGLTTVWVQAQEQIPGDATATAEAVAPPPGQETGEAVEEMRQAEQDPQVPTLTLALAEQFLDAAKAEARKQGWTMSFAVVDASGRQIALIRMDGARWMTARVAQAKAFTAATFRRPSASVEELAEQRPDLFQSLTQLVGEPMLLAGGGLPIVIEGTLLGGVGASGGTEAEDIDCAQVGLDAIGAE